MVSFNASIPLRFEHQVHFTRDALSPGNPVLAQVIAPPAEPASAGVTDPVPAPARPTRVLTFVDTHVAQAVPTLPDRLRSYFAAQADRVELVGRVQPVMGGELCKNDRDAIYRILEAIDAARLDRQSYVLVIGGGAVLDCVGFAASIAHRGLRLIRMPTTTLAQADSGIGVKNGINSFGKKNYLGSFAVPWAVVNDEQLLETLSDRDWRCGFAEAVKVALLKDRAFFKAIRAAAPAICQRNMPVAMPIIQRSAQLHLEHIAQGGDPFELTTARPLDFGHWSAHKLEQITDFTVRHGEAVAIGLALDVTYAEILGMLATEDAQAVRQCLIDLGFELYHPAMDDGAALLAGLDEFREHLGGELTITLIRAIGQAVNVHEIDAAAMLQACEQLKELEGVRSPRR